MVDFDRSISTNSIKGTKEDNTYTIFSNDYRPSRIRVEVELQGGVWIRVEDELWLNADSEGFLIESGRA